MRFLLNRWRGIGTRLYLALGFAVVLTLISSAVGVYYFERSGNLNYEAESQSVPALEASWEAAREAERLRGLGLELLSGSAEVQTGTVDGSISRLEAALARPSCVPSLANDAAAVQAAAYGVADSIDSLRLNQGALLQTGEAVAGLRERMAAIPADSESSIEGLRLLGRVFRAGSQAELDAMWDEFTALSQRGLEAPIAEVGGGQGVFAARGQQLVLLEQKQELSTSFESAGAVLGDASATLVEGSGVYASESLGQAVESFDQGRVLLLVISIVSVIAATIAAWLWVGNAVVRRLSNLSERMRGMASGDLETPVPEVGRDEIGQLADALEHFRQQALEVQRLNLVEQLYGELRDANAELQRMQARLVAQEKLAALGELVSGVAREISNPLNFVKNFSEGSLDLYGELSEMLASYRDRMSEDDATLLDDLTGEITESLNRVSYNGGRALAIVERMRSLSVEGGDPVMTEINPVLQQAAQQGCEIFKAEWEDFDVDLVLDLDPTVGETMLVEREFGEAVVNLVSNACYAMHQKRQEQAEAAPSLGSHEPELDGSEDEQEQGEAVGEPTAMVPEEVYSPRLTVSSHVVDGMIEVRVRDNGPGIAEDLVDRIFNPFFTTREGILGAGLGLPIAADIARRTGGDLVVDTVAGEYAEFTMHVPIAAEEEDVAEDLQGDGTSEGAAPEDTPANDAVEDPAPVS